jgi:hypothetical protein
MLTTSAPTLVAGAEALWLWLKPLKLMLPRGASGRTSREFCLRKRLGEGSCELLRPNTGDDFAECEREGVCWGTGLGRSGSNVFLVGESVDSVGLGKRMGVRREGVGDSRSEPWDCASLSLSSRSSRAFASARSLSI